jgi:hypothetical protein
MVKDKTPLPRIDDMIDTLVKGRYYTKMDIIWGYNNVRIKEGHEWKAAFLMPWGQKETKVIELEKQKPHLFSAEAGLMLFEGRVYIPPDPKIRQEILHDAHDAPVAGHPGIFKTNELMG